MAHVSIELPPAAPAATAFLHHDDPKAHALVGDGSSSDKTDGWCLDTSATHHMTARREFFTELDSDVRRLRHPHRQDWRAPVAHRCLLHPHAEELHHQLGTAG
jgi:hypothetical protein